MVKKLIFDKRRVLAPLILSLVLSLTAGSVAAVDQGLYFKDPVVGTFSWRAIEKGANVVVDIYYSNPNNYEKLSSAALNLYYDNAIIENISISKLCSAMVLSPPAYIENGSSSKVVVGLTSSSNPGQGDLIMGADNALIRIAFRVKQTTSASTLNVRWVGGNETGVMIGGTGAGQYLAVHDTIVGVLIKEAYTPQFDGIGTAADPQTGNTLNLSWASGGALSANNHDNDAGTYNSTVQNAAATYYSNGKLKHRIYRGGALVYTSATAGDVTWSNTGLNDMQEYTFKTTAIDDCSPAVNESVNTNTFTGTPHDYTPPGATITLRWTKDQEIDLSWGCTDGGDLGGYVVVRKEGGLTETQPDAPDIAGAAGNADGTSPDAAKTTLTGAGWTVVSEGTGTSLDDMDLDNSKKYTYWVYAYDKVGGSPVNQGYNYSKAKLEAVPGAAPEAISNFQALSNVGNGITFKWLTSAPPNYAGCKIVYTTNYDEWNILGQTSPEAADKLFTGTTAGTDEVVWTGLDKGKTYYFKAFAHNSSSLLWSPPVFAAAVPGGIGANLAFTVNLKGNATDKLVVNTIAIPSTTLADGSVPTAVELKNFINGKAGERIVTAISRWDPVAGAAEGVTFNLADGTIVSGADFPLDPGVGYQVFTTKDCDITLTGR